ncbi:MAG: hypothetical protein PHV00_08140 [Syntrophales bacterium]|nr:hypothetical protein [Syntrophales bacterium]HOG08372.1 hypothetical protein [Syntrophales bacterium]HOS77957.1 hypothetical protein [Syntrophales bacterium]HPB70987.1 hypothetical protein [Syntrophales bacterium]HQN25944.1 hypothetical protein [Syntrophales bacterium]
MTRRERMTDRDLFFNYCLWAYEPVAPWQDKWRSANLLFHSFERAGADDRMFDLVERLRGTVGPSMTVWGVKWAGGKIGWEYYFYDYRRRERERSAAKVLQGMAPLVRSSVRLNENHHYFMFSLDIDDALVTGARSVDEIHMYIGNPGSDVSSGICYAVTPAGSRLENFYFFFDARRHREDILNKIACSAQIDQGAVELGEIYRPELRDCRTICLANKQRTDCIYFSGITVDQLIFFLNWLDYPRSLCSLVERNRSRLDHLLYDVGFDYRMESDRLRIEKSGYYGIF